MAMYSSRVIWEQYKEPALSAPLVQFVNPQEDSIVLPFDLPDSIENYTKEDIIEIAKAAKIVDESDGKSLYKKLEQAMEQKNVAIVVNAIDDEPYLSSKVNPLLSLREEVVGGIQLCQIITGADTDDVFITVYRHLMDIESNIPSHIDKYKVVRLGGGYPVSPSPSQLRQLRGRSRLSVGVGAIIHLYRAIILGKKQTTSFVTVHGNAVANPMNLEVSFDMNVTQVLERCGLAQDPTRVVVGGPMTGFAVLDTDKTLMTPTTRGVLAFVRKEQEFLYSCIGCGRCERACPVGLNPMYIHQLVNSGNRSVLAFYDPQNCIGCGMCSYVCPSRLRVAVSVAEAKRLVYSGEATLPQSEYSWEDFKSTLRYVGGVIWNAVKTVSLTIAKGLVIVGTVLWKGITLAAKGIAKGAKIVGAFLKKTSQSGATSFKTWRADRTEKQAEQEKIKEERAAALAAQQAAAQELAAEKERILEQLEAAKQQQSSQQEGTISQQVVDELPSDSPDSTSSNGIEPETAESSEEITHLADILPRATPLEEHSAAPTAREQEAQQTTATAEKEEHDEV